MDFFYLNKISNFIFISIENAMESFLDTLFCAINFMLSKSNNYDELVLVLIGGELTLLTLFFALLPMLLEKQNKQFYLGYEISKFFLYGNYLCGKEKINELIKTWIIGIILIVATIVLCAFTLNHLTMLFFIFFVIFLTFKVIHYLVFISNPDQVKSKIETAFSQGIQVNSESFIQTMVNTSKDDLKVIYDNMDFLFNFPNTSILNTYTNKLLDIKGIDQEAIYFKISENINKNKYNYNYNFNNYNLYKFLRNSVNDFNKEDYYGVIYTLLVHNFQNYIANQTNDVMPITIFTAIEDSRLSSNNKQYLKNRIINSMHPYMIINNDISDYKYVRTYKYRFSILKYVIDNKNFDLFNKFIRKNNIIHENYGIVSDLYLTCFLYFYYLIKVETDKYISQNNHIKLFNDKFLKNIVKKYRKKGFKIMFFNNYNIFKLPYLNEDEFTVDGVHPNDIGMYLLFKNYLKAIRKVEKI